MSRRSLGLAVAAMGVIVTLIGVVGLITSGDSGDTEQSTGQPTGPVATTGSTEGATTTSTTTTSPTSTTTSTTTTVTTTTTTHPRPTGAEQIETFVAEFTAAIASGDRGFVLSRFHPAVIAGYGESLCSDWVDREIMALSDYELTGSPSGPETRSFEIASESVEVEDAYSAPVSFVFQGERFDGTAGFAIVDGAVHWLGQCR